MKRQNVELHVLRVRDENGVMYWVCDSDGARIMKVKARGFSHAVDKWIMEASRFQDVAVTKEVTYRSAMKPSEAAMTIADLKMRAEQAKQVAVEEAQTLAVNAQTEPSASPSEEPAVLDAILNSGTQAEVDAWEEAEIDRRMSEYYGGLPEKKDGAK